jgi:cephalosporin hydroxylase
MMFNGWHNIEQRPKKQHRGPVITAQIDWEIMQLIRVYDRLKPKHVLEIGSQYGGTLWYWLEGAQEGAVVVNIDILQNLKDEEKAELPLTWASWPPYGVVYHGLIGRSDDPAIVAQALKYLDGWIDFLFIDALHTYEGSKLDFMTFGPFVKPGGVIVLHDLITPEFSPHIQIGKLWDEIQRAGYKTQELRAGAAWGGIGIVYT